jgi:hypothetical protein
MKGLLFFLVLLGIGLVFWTTYTNEGFQDSTPEAANPKPVIPLISPRYQTLTSGDVQAFAPPSTTLLGPPPGQSASVNTQPASDPAMEKAKAGRIQSVYESLIGFFKTDAPGLQKIGDPSIQLPLATARSDQGRLKDEMTVLSRNPGLESNITDEDLDGIEANLGYLQKKWRMSTNAMSGGPMPPEGFQNGGGVFSWLFGGSQEGFQASTFVQCPATSPNGFTYILTGNTCVEQCPSSGYTSIASTPPTCKNNASQQTYVLVNVAAINPNTLGPGTGSSGSSGTGSLAAAVAAAAASSGASTTGTGGGGGGAGGSDVSLKDLQDLSLRINVEIIRLQSSGTTDLNIQSRINVLTTIRKTVDDLIDEVNKGIRMLKDVPLTNADIAKFLPAMTNLNTAIPNLINDAGANKFLNSLFPMFSVGDISGAAIAKQMFQAYGQDFFKNLSWDVAFSYKGQAEKDIAQNYATAATEMAAASTSGAGSGEEANAAPSSAYRGLLDSIVGSQTGMTPSYVSAGIGGAPHNTAAPSSTGPPQRLDWKERSKQICAQITARDMDPNDFGCLANPDAMKQESFSWRGYTRMVCNRLNTVYDTSVPFLCGCPPPTWEGWRQ